MRGIAIRMGIILMLLARMLLHTCKANVRTGNTLTQVSYLLTILLLAKPKQGSSSAFASSKLVMRSQTYRNIQAFEDPLENPVSKGPFNAGSLTVDIIGHVACQALPS